MIKYYAVTEIVKEMPIEVNIPVPAVGRLNLKQEWAEGMIGVIPVFKSNESAEKYIKEQNRECKSQIIELEALSEPEHAPEDPAVDQEKVGG